MCSMRPSGKFSAPELKNSRALKQTLSVIASYYDRCKVGYEGFEGYRKSTDLARLGSCIAELLSLGLIHPQDTIFADLGCADGRVNVLMSYFVSTSIGIEIEPDILAEFTPRLDGVRRTLERSGLLLPPDNVHLFRGDSLRAETYSHISQSLDTGFSDIDLFYTYITLHDLFAEKIAEEARDGALYLVYGFKDILPRYQGLELLIPDLGSQGIVALYRKKGAW